MSTNRKHTENSDLLGANFHTVTDAELLKSTDECINNNFQIK